jgi:flagellar hook-length control protein FliK
VKIERRRATADLASSRRGSPPVAKGKSFAEELRQKGKKDPNRPAGLADPDRELERMDVPSRRKEAGGTEPPVLLNLAGAAALPRHRPVEEPPPVTGPPEIQNLVQEMVVAIDAVGCERVEIQLDSKTLDGLRIQIRNQGGEVAIRFFSHSPEVTQFLTQNLPALSQAMANRGIRVGACRVEKGSDSQRRGFGSGRQQQQRGAR